MWAFRTQINEKSGDSSVTVPKLQSKAPSILIGQEAG
jgi:hypothetical protein